GRRVPSARVLLLRPGHGAPHERAPSAAAEPLRRAGAGLGCQRAAPPGRRKGHAAGLRRAPHPARDASVHAVGLLDRQRRRDLQPALDRAGKLIRDLTPTVSGWAMGSSRRQPLALAGPRSVVGTGWRAVAVLP